MCVLLKLLLSILKLLLVFACAIHTTDELKYTIDDIFIRANVSCHPI